MEITTDVKTHVIITMQGGHYFITDRLNQQLERMSLDDMLTTPDDVQVKVSTIVEVLPVGKYYEQYLEKRTQNYGQPYTDVKTLPGGFQSIIHKATEIRHIELLFAGFNRTRKDPDNPLRKVIENKLAFLKATT